MAPPAQSLIAIDIGNSRIKAGKFDWGGSCATAARPAELPIAPPPLVEPAEVFAFAPRSANGEAVALEPLVEWIDEQSSSETHVVIGSVSPATTDRLRQALGERARVRVLRGEDLPIANLTRYPERVGIDRLAAAVGANRLRRPGGPLIVVDYGTAITVDLVTSEGEFAGGAILPGLGTQARSLRQGTAALPEIVLDLEGKSPVAVGKDTEEAIAAGIYWGSVGAVRELIARQSDRLVIPPQVLVTGSTSPEMARLLGSPDLAVRYLPHLVLSGLALATGNA
jgi:type III pantothenate kinase